MTRHRGAARLLGILLLVVLLFPASVAAAQAAQTTGKDDGFVMQVNTPISIGANEVMGGVVSINANAVVDGRVKDTLWVINGTGTVNGRVEGDVMVVNGTLNLGANAVVKNVTLVRSDMNRAQGAQITGDLNRRSEFVSFGWGATIFSFVFWLGTTVVILLAGMAFVALGGRHLTETAQTMTTRPGESFVTAIVTWVLLPVVAIMAFITLVGIPLGLAILLVLVPLLALMGYIVAGERLGMWLASVTNLQAGRYVPVIVGLLAMQIVGLIPWIGGLLVFLATFVGSGALVYHLYRDRRARRAAPAAPAQAAHA